MLTQNYTIDMIPSGVPLTLHVTQYDVGMTQFVFTPFTSNGVLDLSTATSANIEATKSDGYAVVHPCTLSADKTATYVLQEQLAAVEGLVYSKLVYRDATGKALASKAIVWRVAMAGVTDESVISDSDIPLLEQAIQMGTVVTDAIANIDDRIAEQVSQMQVIEGQTVIDATLTVAGAAADAKATGDNITQLKNDFKFITDPFVNLESGTYQDANGTTKVNNTYRIRNAQPLDIRTIYSITIPDGYSAYIFLLNKNKSKLGTVNWKTGEIIILEIVTSETVYINFAIRKNDTPSSNISSYIPYVQENILLVSNNTVLPREMNGYSESLKDLGNEIEKYVRLKDDVTSEFTISTGQAYGSVGSIITVDTSSAYKHIKLLRTDDVQSVLFNTAYYSTVSSYVQYVDANERILKREYVQGNYDVSTIYECVLDFPNDAVAVYITSGQLNASQDHILIALRNNDKTITIAYDELKSEIDSKAQKNEIVASVCRIAQGFSAPTQSLAAYKNAIKAGMVHLLCDVRYTSDGYIVLCHDNDISSVAKNADGTDIPANTVLISNSTLADLLQYDFGIGYSQDYAGTKILQLPELLDLCYKNQCIIHLELKDTMTTERCAKIFKLLTNYGMRDNAIFDIQYSGQAPALKAYTPYFKFGVHTNIEAGASTDSVLEYINECVECINDYNRESVFLTCRLDGIIGTSTEALMIANDIKLMGTTFNTYAQVETFISRGVPYSNMRYALTNNGIRVDKVISNL